ncbi:GSCOCG00000541001-RA-CDS [Cotesia congregata]|nr:GSCOCG00000541001-RA-CDS [Cotesia congregata]
MVKKTPRSVIRFIYTLQNDKTEADRPSRFVPVHRKFILKFSTLLDIYIYVRARYIYKYKTRVLALVYTFLLFILM